MTEKKTCNSCVVHYYFYRDPNSAVGWDVDFPPTITWIFFVLILELIKEASIASRFIL